MNKIIYSFLFILAAGLFFPSCEDEIDIAPDAPDLFDTKGSVASFSLTDSSPDFFDTGAPDTPVSFDLTTLGEPANSVRILKNLNGTGEIEHAVISSLPTTVSVSLNDALVGTGQTLEDMKVGDNFLLSFEVTTATGTYITGNTISISVSCSTKLPGTYDYVSTDHFCGDGPINGTVTITETDPGRYTFDDWAFGTYQECYGVTASSGGSLAFVRYTDPSCDECSQSEMCNTISIEGVDDYGDSWTFTVDAVMGSELTMSWENTYGEFGTVTLIRTDGSDWPPLK